MGNICLEGQGIGVLCKGLFDDTPQFYHKVAGVQLYQLVPKSLFPVLSAHPKLSSPPKASVLHTQVSEPDKLLF